MQDVYRLRVDLNTSCLDPLMNESPFNKVIVVFFLLLLFFLSVRLPIFQSKTIWAMSQHFLYSWTCVVWPFGLSKFWLSSLNSLVPYLRSITTGPHQTKHNETMWASQNNRISDTHTVVSWNKLIYSVGHCFRF